MILVLYPREDIDEYLVGQAQEITLHCCLYRYIHVPDIR